VGYFCLQMVEVLLHDHLVGILPFYDGRYVLHQLVSHTVNYPKLKLGASSRWSQLRSLLPLSGSSRLHPGGERHVHDAPCPLSSRLSPHIRKFGSLPNGKPSRTHACYAWPPTHVIITQNINMTPFTPKLKLGHSGVKSCRSFEWIRV